MAATGIDRASGRALQANQTVARSNATVSGQVISAYLKMTPNELAGKSIKIAKEDCFCPTFNFDDASENHLSKKLMCKT